MLTQTQAWMRRIHFPEVRVSRAALGFAGELWDPNPEHYEGWAELSARLASLGRPKRGRALAHRLSASLLDDLIVAAGGAEASIMHFRDAINRAKVLIDSYGLAAEEGVPTGVADISTIEAWYAFSDLLIWVRTVKERVKRKGFGKRIDEQGLLPAIKPKRLKKRVDEALKTYEADAAIAWARELANLTLHASLVQNPMSGIRLRPDGIVFFRIPDPPTGPVAHKDLLTWTQDRDGIELAEGMWTAIVTLVDGVLDAFERGTPRRLTAG